MRWFYHRRAPLAFLAMSCWLLLRSAAGLLPDGPLPVELRRLDPPGGGPAAPAHRGSRGPGAMDLRSAPGAAAAPLAMAFPAGDWRPTAWALGLPDARFAEVGGRLGHASVRLPFLSGGAAYQIEMCLPEASAGAAIRATGRLAASAWLDGRPMARLDDGTWRSGPIGPGGATLRVRALSLRPGRWAVEAIPAR